MLHDDDQQTPAAHVADDVMEDDDSPQYTCSACGREVGVRCDECGLCLDCCAEADDY